MACGVVVMSNISRVNVKSTCDDYHAKPTLINNVRYEPRHGQNVRVLKDQADFQTLITDHRERV